MWGTSSSSFVGVNRDSETTLQSIGHYIEDYIDLVENVPNEIIRGVTQLHEKNHSYHQTLERLEKAISAILAPEITEAKRSKTFRLIYNYLIEIQNLSDDKLYIMQSVYEQLEFKSRQLDHDIRAITLGSGGTNIFSPIKGSRDATNSGSEESNDSQDTQENEHEGNKNDTEPNTATHGTGRKRKRKHPDDDDNEENDADNELPVKEQEKGPTKNRRGGRSGPSGRGGRSGGAGDHEKDHDHEGRGGRKRGGRGNRGGSRGDRKRRTFDDEPSLYDEPSPLDPDEPTYCICQQVSFGEMIGCDNPRCPIEWFHFSCVQLTNKPKGKWFCPQCRGERSNIQRK